MYLSYLRCIIVMQSPPDARNPPFLHVGVFAQRTQSAQEPAVAYYLIELLLCPSVEAFPIWEPEPLNPQSPDRQRERDRFP